MTVHSSPISKASAALGVARSDLRPAAGAPPKALRVLVVEDDILIGHLLAEMLEDLGYVVCAIEISAVNAVAAALRLRPDLMIVDIGLSEGTGVAAVEEIVRGGFVPHVFVTGDVLRDLALGPGAVLIQKPFREGEIVAAIQRALASSAR